jgi:hypothetical protein
VLSGASREWELFSSLPRGEYAAVLRVYHCNEIFEHEPYMFTSAGTTEGEGPLMTGIASRQGRIEVQVSGQDVAVIPEDYPRGWIFQASKAQDGRAILDFVPVGDLSTSITLKAVDASGFSSVREFSVSPGQESGGLPWGTALLLLALLFFALYVSRNIIKIWRR